jgi:hypothetical protein
VGIKEDACIKPNNLYGCSVSSSFKKMYNMNKLSFSYNDGRTKRNLILGTLRLVHKFSVCTPLSSHEEEKIMAGAAANGVYQISTNQGTLTCLFRAITRNVMKIKHLKQRHCR